MLGRQKTITIILLIVIVGAAYITTSQLFTLVAWQQSFDKRPLTPEMPAPRATLQENFGFSKPVGTVSVQATGSPSSSPVVPAPKSNTLTDVSRWSTYRSDKYGFELRYPSSTLPFYEASKDFPPSIFTLLGSTDNVNVSAFVQIIPQDQMNLYPFSSKFDTPPANLAALAAALRAKNNTEMKSVGLNISVTVSDIQGSGGLKGIKSYVESAPRTDGSKIVGIAYYFYRAPYFYRLVSILPGVDAQLGAVASTFKFIPIDLNVGQACGGGPRPDGGTGCPTGYACDVKNMAVDATGTCMKQ